MAVIRSVTLSLRLGRELLPRPTSLTALCTSKVLRSKDESVLFAFLHRERGGEGKDGSSG